jgi:uncharacterized membrane protein
LASTLLFWGGLALGLWPSLRVLSGTWDPHAAPQAWSHLREIQAQAGWPAVLPSASGATLAAIPAGLWTVYGWFHGYYVADEGQGAWQSMVSSFHSVRGAFWRTVGFLIVIALVNALGLALWFAGIFIAFPVTLMATTYVHLELKRQAKAEVRA